MGNAIKDVQMCLWVTKLLPKQSLALPGSDRYTNIFLRVEKFADLYGSLLSRGGVLQFPSFSCGFITLITILFQILVLALLVQFWVFPSINLVLQAAEVISFGSQSNMQRLTKSNCRNPNTGTLWRYDP